MAIVLTIKTEDGGIAELPILSKVILGRSGSSDYKITDAKMSATHCSFEVTPNGELMFTDMGSTNGSFLNNSQIQKTLVRLNDVIRVGNTLIKIDERKLTASEKLSLGSSNVKKRKDKTLPQMTVVTKSGLLQKKKSIIVNKDKDKGTWGGKADNLIEKEKSSGTTKLLKLDKDKDKDKKK